MAVFLITGGAGFIGSSLAQKLLGFGDTVRVLDDFSTGRRENLEDLNGRLEVEEGTILDSDLVKKAASGADVVFHQAAIPSVARSVADPQSSMLTNVQGTTVVLEAACNAGARRFVFAASSAAYGDSPALPKIETMNPAPISPYAISKLAGEHMLRVYASLYGFETVSLRYFNVFGLRQNPKSQYAAVIPKFITCALENTQPVIFGDGEQTRDFCYIENVVDANLLAATTVNKLSGQVVNIACGERTSLNAVLSMIAQAARRAMAARHEPPRLGDVRDSYADISLARTLLNYEPSVRVREGLARMVAHFSGANFERVVQPP